MTLAEANSIVQANGPLVSAMDAAARPVGYNRPGVTPEAKAAAQAIVDAADPALKDALREAFAILNLARQTRRG